MKNASFVSLVISTRWLVVYTSSDLVNSEETITLWWQVMIMFQFHVQIFSRPKKSRLVVTLVTSCVTYKYCHQLQGLIPHTRNELHRLAFLLSFLLHVNLLVYVVGLPVSGRLRFQQSEQTTDWCSLSYNYHYHHQKKYLQSRYITGTYLQQDQAGTKWLNKFAITTTTFMMMIQTCELTCNSENSPSSSDHSSITESILVSSGLVIVVLHKHQ